jgi:glucan endo-1,3-beta-D-glucosidase
MRFTSALSLAFAASAAAENYLGFNSGATKVDNSAKYKSDFVAEFTTSQNLEGAPGNFNAVRLYTNIQAYSQEEPIEAFEAAIETKTKLLLGVWASGVDNIDKEINALRKAVDTWGSKLTDLVIGVSIGSEDLYRVSPTGLKNDPEGIGAQPDVLVNFINDFKKAFKDTGLSKVPVGHVDTWDVWGLPENKVVVDAIDFLGVDEYPYYENDKGNSIDNAANLFQRAFDITVEAANGKPVWVTETGWPVTGPDWDEAVPSTENAEKYWREVGCEKLFGEVPTFWYTLRDSNSANKMKFAVTENLSTTPSYNLTCPAKGDKSSSSSGSSKPTGSSSGSGSGSGSKTGSATATGTGYNTAYPTDTGSAGVYPTYTGGLNGTATATGGSGSGSGSGSGAGGAGGATPTPTTVSSPSGTASSSNVPVAAAPANMASGATCAGLALVAGLFALF